MLILIFNIISSKNHRGNNSDIKKKVYCFFPSSIIPLIFLISTIFLSEAFKENKHDI